jgi:hypothetical protein
MADYHVGPAQPYATPQAAWNAMEGDGVPFPAGGNNMILHAATYTSWLDISAKEPIMTAANPLRITVSPGDVVTWNNGTDRCCFERINRNVPISCYVEIDGTGGTLLIEGAIAGVDTIEVNCWMNQLYITNCSVYGENLAGNGGVGVGNGFGIVTDCDFQFDNVTFQAPQGMPVGLRDGGTSGPTGFIRNCAFTNWDTYAIQFRARAKTFAVYDNTFSAAPNADSVFRFRQTTNGASTLSLYGNTITGCGGAGASAFFLHGLASAGMTENVAIYTNLFYNNGTGMSFLSDEGGTADCQYNIYNNTMDGENTLTNWFIRIQGEAASNYLIRNNIFYDCNDAAGAIQEAGGYAGTETINWNCWFSNALDVGVGLAKGANQVNGDPLFTNEGADDYTLQAGSPCIDAGTDLGLGDDIGRYQYIAPAVAFMTMNRGYW